jgi:beta-lactamase regulating signal transducer with metallopeptidase domain
MNALAAGWWTWMLPMLWQTALLAGLVWAADLILKRWGWPQVRYALWLLVVARLVIPPSFALPTSLSARLLHPHGSAVAAIQSSALIPDDSVPVMAPIESALTFPAPPRATLSAESWAMLCATAVSLFFLGWLLARLLRLSRLVRRAGETPIPARVAEAFAHHAMQFHMRRPPRLVLTSNVQSAGVCGVWRPLVLLPESYCELSHEQLGHVFAHEFAHLKRGDPIVNAIQSLLHIVYWFNPALWLAGRRLRDLREICCDAAVSVRLRERTREYGLTLLTAAAHCPQARLEPELGLLGLFENPAFLRRRIEYLAHPAWKHRRLRWIAAAATAALVTLFVMPMAALKAAPEPKQPDSISNADVVQEGTGWGAACIGATRQEVLAAFGPSEDSNPVWSYYGRRLGIDVFYGELLHATDGDKAMEIRFNPGFKYKLTKGIGIGSSTKEVFEAYGRPVDTKRVQDKNAARFDSQVLYILPAASKILYEKLGVLFWFDASNCVTQFVVFRARPSPTEGNAPASNGEAPTGLPQGKQISDINAKVAKLDIEKATREDVVAVFGEPARYAWGGKTFTKDNLPNAYVMVYPGLLNVEMFSGQVEELRFGEGNGPSDYVFGNGLRVGSSLDEALKVIGPPDKTVEGGEIGFEDGVLYKNAHFTSGDGRSQTASYYARRSRGVRIFLLGDKVVSLYVTRNGPSPSFGGAGLPADQPISDYNAKVAKLDLEKATPADIIGVFGEPAYYEGYKGKIFTKESLPVSYVMYYNNAFYVEIFNNQVEELRFGSSKSDYVFGDGLRVGSSLEEALKVMGAPDQTVDLKGRNMPLGHNGVLLKNGPQGVGHYARRERGVEIFIRNDEVFLLYVTRKSQINPWTAEQVKNKIVDRTDYPFVDDPAVHGQWFSVGYVKTIEEFRPNEKQGRTKFPLAEMNFLDDGKVVVTFDRSRPPALELTWTKGLILSKEEHTASAYTIKTLGGMDYLFYEWKTDAYVYLHMKPDYYVLTQAGGEN